MAVARVLALAQRHRRQGSGGSEAGAAHHRRQSSGGSEWRGAGPSPVTRTSPTDARPRWGASAEASVPEGAEDEASLRSPSLNEAHDPQPQLHSSANEARDP